jgi:hypothetical protein
MASVLANEHEEALDQHVAYFLRKHPEFFKQHTISRIQPGWYNLDGRQISVEWHYGDNGEEGFLVAVDGPLRQAFADYIQGTEVNAQFDSNRLPRSSLQQIPKERQLSFGNMHKEVSRLEAMKIAKEQALVREMAAEYAKDGHAVPESALMERYRKTIDKKLGNRGSRQTKPAPVAAPTAAAPAPEPIQPAWWPQTQAQSDGRQNGHPSPIFCSNHDATEKRKKIAPRNAECTRCKEVVQTNYAEFSLCHECSRSENRCLCCGVGVSGQQHQHQQCQAQVQQCQGQVQQGQEQMQTPAYCPNHDTSAKREKTQPRNVACTSCNVTIQTNYVDFKLCAPCSQAEQRCLCCGAGITTPSAQTPSTVAGMFKPTAGIGLPTLGFPPLPSMQMLPNQSMSQLPMASQNMFAHMAPANRLMSQRVF